MNLKFEDPSVELVSFKVLLAKGFEQNVALPNSGIRYKLSVAGYTLVHGVATNILTAGAYGESRFVVPISTSLLGGIRVIN